MQNIKQCISQQAKLAVMKHFKQKNLHIRIPPSCLVPVRKRPQERRNSCWPSTSICLFSSQFHTPKWVTTRNWLPFAKRGCRSSRECKWVTLKCKSKFDFQKWDTDAPCPHTIFFFGHFFFSCQGRLAVNFNYTMFQNERIVDLLFLKYWFDELLFVCSELVIGI